MGYGFILVHASLHTTDGILSDTDTDGTDIGVIGLTLPKGRVRPFAEVYLIDLLERLSAVSGHLLFGVNLTISTDEDLPETLLTGRVPFLSLAARTRREDECETEDLFHSCDATPRRHGCWSPGWGSG